MIITTTSTPITLMSRNHKVSSYISILRFPVISTSRKVKFFTIPLNVVFCFLYSIKYNHNQIKKAPIYPSIGPALYREAGLIPIARSLRRNRKRGQFISDLFPLIDKWSHYENLFLIIIYNPKLFIFHSLKKDESASLNKSSSFILEIINSMESSVGIS